MNNLKTFWFNPQAPTGYHEHMKRYASGVEDEETVAEIISKYLPTKNKVIADLGIGTGRELDWMDKLPKIKKIIGLDYSPYMTDFITKNKAKYSKSIELIVDDLFKPHQLAKIAKKEKSPIIYLSLINTFGNFTKHERIRVLKNIRFLMLPKDRIVLALYKISQSTKLTDAIAKVASLQTVDPNDQSILAELVEYGLLQFFWTSVMDKYNQLPRFWYDKKNNDVIVHVDGKRLLASHRFSKGEIEEEFTVANLKVAKMIEGKAMWIVVGKV